MRIRNLKSGKAYFNRLTYFYENSHNIEDFYGLSKIYYMSWGLTYSHEMSASNGRLISIKANF